jgi:hypothetical protein
MNDQSTILGIIYHFFWFCCIKTKREEGRDIQEERASKQKNDLLKLQTERGIWNIALV